MRGAAFLQKTQKQDPKKNKETKDSPMIQAVRKHLLKMFEDKYQETTSKMYDAFQRVDDVNNSEIRHLYEDEEHDKED